MKFQLAIFNLAFLLPFVASQSCTDEPEGWVVDHVYDCEWFEAQPGNCDVFGEGTDGLTASEACCACGGGDRSPVRSPITRGPTRAPTAAPTGGGNPTVSEYVVASRNTYPDEDHKRICRDFFGSSATVADWNDFDDMSATRMDRVLDDLNLNPNKKYFVTLDSYKFVQYSLNAYYATTKNQGHMIDTIRTDGSFALGLKSDVDFQGRVICKTVAKDTWDD